MARFSTRRRRGWLRKPLTSVLGFVLVAPMLLIATAVGTTVAPLGAAAQPSAALVVSNPNVDVYDAAGNAAATAAVNSAVDKLKADHYSLMNHYASTADGTGSATIANFLSLAQQDIGVLIMVTHGSQYGYVGSTCQWTGKTTVDGSAAYYEPSVMVQFFPTETQADAAEGTYAAGSSRCDWATSAPEKGANAYWGVALTQEGIQHYFAESDIDLMFGAICYGATLKDPFGAQDFFGYTPNVTVGKAGGDLTKLVDDLTGNVKVTDDGTAPDDRVTTQAAQHISLDLQGPNGDSPTPLVLSPAVTAVDPAENAKLGGSESGSVTFDAQMDTSNVSDVVTVSGCGASITAGSWNDDGSNLSYTLNIPQDESGTATLTVSNTQAQGAPGGNPNDKLDGNPTGSGENGSEPSGSDYTWKVLCKESKHHRHSVKLTSVDWTDSIMVNTAYNITLAWRGHPVLPITATFTPKPSCSYGDFVCQGDSFVSSANPIVWPDGDFCYGASYVLGEVPEVHTGEWEFQLTDAAGNTSNIITKTQTCTIPASDAPLLRHDAKVTFKGVG